MKKSLGTSFGTWISCFLGKKTPILAQYDRNKGKYGPFLDENLWPKSQESTEKRRVPVPVTHLCGSSLNIFHLLRKNILNNLTVARGGNAGSHWLNRGVQLYKIELGHGFLKYLPYLTVAESFIFSKPHLLENTGTTKIKEQLKVASPQVSRPLTGFSS
jgi:hypothetical protein